MAHGIGGPGVTGIGTREPMVSAGARSARWAIAWCVIRREALARGAGSGAARREPVASIRRGTDCEYSEFSVYDPGQAVAHMTFQAQSLGLSVRQFRAFDRDGLAAEFDVAPHWEVTTMSAVGRAPADVLHLPRQHPMECGRPAFADRHRRSLAPRRSQRTAMPTEPMGLTEI